ncbi:hypothetical protein LguiB_015538 [Lonicera macranthoides]
MASSSDEPATKPPEVKWFFVFSLSTTTLSLKLLFKGFSFDNNYIIWIVLGSLQFAVCV